MAQWGNLREPMAQWKNLGKPTRVDMNEYKEHKHKLWFERGIKWFLGPCAYPLSYEV